MTCFNLFHVKHGVRAALIGGVLLNLQVACNSVFYQPDNVIRGFPSDIGMPFHEFDLELFGRENINGWVVPSKAPRSSGTVVHFHGNAQNMTAHYAFVSWLSEFGFEVVVFDYRGYGKSVGRPTREGSVSDGILVLKYVTEQLKRRNVFVLGQSLGGAVAVAALGEYLHPAIRAVVLESTFASYRELAQEKIAGFTPLAPLQWPLSFLVTDTYAPRRAAKYLHELPVLMLHGTADPVVPHWHGKELFAELEATAESHVFRRFEFVEAGGHTPSLYSSESPYRKMVVDFFAKFAKPLPLLSAH